MSLGSARDYGADRDLRDLGVEPQSGRQSLAPVSAGSRLASAQTILALAPDVLLQERDQQIGQRLLRELGVRLSVGELLALEESATDSPSASAGT